MACAGFIEEYILKPITSAGRIYTKQYKEFCPQIPILNEGIKAFYDESSALWESVWGEHMHHGYYDAGDFRQKGRIQAQLDMIEKSLLFSGVDKPKEILDVGCGIGGSSRHISKKYGCLATGITLSPKQAQRANELAAAAGLADQCNFQVADALQQPFVDGAFDFVWSMESGEHMPDKRRFVSELHRVLEPGGKVVIVTWCHRNLLPGEAVLKPDEQALLDRINEAYYLPPWCSLVDYEKIFGEMGFSNVQTADWSNNVAPFWDAVIQSALTPEGLRGLLGAGWGTLKGALVMPLMKRGFETGVVKFVAITGTKAPLSG